MERLNPNRVAPALFVALTLCAGAAWAQSPSPSLRLLEASPLSFERNMGQVDAQARLVARSNGYTLLLTTEGPILRLPGARDVQMTLVGGQKNAALTEEAALPGVVNYFIGNDPSRWRTDIPTFARARYSQVYPGIDLVYYGAKGRLEYDFVVAPGSDPGSIAMKFSGVAGIDIEDDGDLALRVGGETLTMEKPTLYQEIGGARRAVSGSFRRLPTGTIGFDVGEYDRTRSLVIDPVLVYSSRFEASPSGGVQDIVVDGAGAAYVAGSNNIGQNDVFVAKLNATGSALLFTTYLGSMSSETAASIELDAAGNILVAGETSSFDFPTLNAAQPVHAGVNLPDAFLLKLTPAGNALVYSTFLGGSLQEAATAVTVDSEGYAYVTGTTRSSDFPLTLPLQPTRAGAQDGFIAKFDPLGTRALSTYFGGSGDDTPLGLTVISNTVVVVGSTPSADLLVTGNALQPFLRGTSDGFVTQLSALDFSLVYSTYLGGTAADLVSDVAVGPGGAYLVGSTFSNNFPTTGGVVQPLDPTTSQDGFLMKVSPNLTTIIYSTYLRGAAAHVAVDVTGRAVVTGAATSGVPLVGALLTVPVISSDDGTIFEVNASGTAYLLSTYWPDANAAVAVDTSGDVYVAGVTGFNAFPVTPGALQSSSGFSWTSGYVSKINLQTPPCSYEVRPEYSVIFQSGAVISVVAPSGCAWTAATSDSWISLSGTTSGAGVGIIRYSVAAPTFATRSGSITVAGRIITVVQPGTSCSYAVTPPAIQPSGGGIATATVTTSPGCAWDAQPGAGWASGSTGTGSGTVTLQIQPNPSVEPRSTPVRVGATQQSAGSTVTLTQAGTCDVTISPSGTIELPRIGGTGIVTATVSPPDCAWNVVGGLSWLAYSPSASVGSSTIAYAVAPTTDGFARAAFLKVAGQVLQINEAGVLPFSGTPLVLPPSPAAGSGTTKTFTFTFYDHGATNLDVVNILVNSFLDGRFGCYLAYARPNNVLYLVNDPGDALLPGLVLDGSPQTVGNGQCAIDGSASSAVAAGSVLTLTIRITFEPSFAGNKVVYQAARDLDGNNSGWVQQGVWNIPGSTSASPAVISMTPGRGAGRGPYPLQFTFRDAEGYTDLVSTTVLLNGYLDGGSACYLGYHVPSNAILLLNDAGNGYLPGLVLGAAGWVENSQCRIYSQGSGSVGSGTDLTLTLMIEFKAGFAGERVFYLSAQDGVATSGWQAMGSWTVP